MKIFLSSTANTKFINEFLEFNQISYQKIDLWNPEIDPPGRYILDYNKLTQESTLLILDGTVFYALCQWPQSQQQLLNFCKKNNHIWVWDDLDGLVYNLYNTKTLLEIDQVISNKSVTIFVDGMLSDRHPLTQLKNIVWHSRPHSVFMRAPRIKNAIVTKKNCSRDFMLTMRKKQGAPERVFLWNTLRDREGLLERGWTNFTDSKTKKSDIWLGEQEHQSTWLDGHPSMDLYLDSWLELVPETLYRNGFFVTEKTIKPITTQTPFLIFGTCGYLKYLHSFGFKTFDSLISEQYDSEFHYEDRVQLLVNQLEDIVRNGAKDFYLASRHILEHNQNRLFEITGRWTYDSDRFIRQHLEQLL